VGGERSGARQSRECRRGEARLIVVGRNGDPLGERPNFRPQESEEAVWEFLDEQDRRVTLALRAKRLSTAARQIKREFEDGFVYLRFDEFDGPTVAG